MAKTYNELYMEMRRRLREEGIESYAPEARWLLQSADGCSDAQLAARMSLYVPEATERKAHFMLRRRLAGEPVAYITGIWQFYGLTMFITPDVLIPRMDTELLVSKALELLGHKADARILDLCCGSGCIGCALAHELPQSRVVMADISQEALTVARKNVSLLRLSPRCVCMTADALSDPPVRMENFDLLACNPPYIPAGELEGLDISVRCYEPALALDGGEDGLVFYRAVLPHWKSVLKDGGALIFEVGEGEAASVCSLLAENGFSDIGTAKDTLGTDRVVFGRKSSKE